jgi:hypothetical protein
MDYAGMLAFGKQYTSVASYSNSNAYSMQPPSLHQAVDGYIHYDHIISAIER